jgi:hypothetical protein
MYPSTYIAEMIDRSAVTQRPGPGWILEIHTGRITADEHATRTCAAA